MGESSRHPAGDQKECEGEQFRKEEFYAAER